MQVDPLELEAAAKLAGQISQPIALCKLAYNRVLDTTAQFNGRSEAASSLQAELILLGRIASDLRAVIYLTSMGYGDQAGSLAAGMFEAAHLVSTIGKDDQLAEDWAAWNDPTKSFLSVRKTIRASVAGAQLDKPDEHIRNEGKCYAQLCWTKHPSPLMLGYRDPSEWPKEGMLRIGPDVSERGQRVAWYALTHAARLAIVACDAVWRNHIGQNEPPETMRTLRDWEDLYFACVAAAKQRWGDKDPFPGQW